MTILHFERNDSLAACTRKSIACQDFNFIMPTELVRLRSNDVMFVAPHTQFFNEKLLLQFKIALEPVGLQKPDALRVHNAQFYIGRVARIRREIRVRAKRFSMRAVNKCAGPDRDV